MKNIIKVFLLSLLSFSATAQSKPVNIVFDVTSADPKTHQSAIRHVKFMSSSYPDAKFEVVLYSGSYEMALKEESSVAKEIADLADNENVSFKICAMTLKRKEIDKSALIDNIEIVPDGILEIAMKQSEGWGYIKESHH